MTVQVSNVGSWGPDCTTDQVYRQAVESAIGRVRNAFAKDARGGVKIVGTPVVQAITTDMEKRP
jgi:hypothetical protein